MRDDLESLLRSNRPEPRPAFLKSLAADFRGTRRRRALSWHRVAVAGALTGTMVAGFGAAGGLGYARTTASQAVHKVNAVFQSGRGGDRSLSLFSAAQANYAAQPPPPPP